MKTHNNALTPARLPRIIRESAPSLVKGQKGRAKETLPAPPRMPGAFEFPEHERAVIDAALAILRNRLRELGWFAARGFMRV